MSAVQYPFIDIAVHPRIRARLAGGEAIVIFSPDMRRALWANGRGAELFGHASIYDFLDNGTSPANVSFRQAEAAARALRTIGDVRPFVIRVTNGFQRSTVQAHCELITIGRDPAILFAAPMQETQMSVAQCAASMIEGFDDTDTHRAVLDQNGQVLAASPRFSELDLTPHTARMLINMVASHGDSPVKRPVPTKLGYLPAAIGKVSDTPLLHLLFIVEADTVSGGAIPMEDRRDRMDAEPEAPAVVVPTEEPAEIEDELNMNDAPAADGYAAALDALADISEVDDEPTEEEDFRREDEADETAAEAAETEQAMAEVAKAIRQTVADAEDADADVLETATSVDAQELPVEEASVDEQATEEAPAEVTDVADDGDTEETETAVAEPTSDESEPSTPASLFNFAHTETDSEPFVFSPDMRATRFVWKIDAEGRFSEVSGEFARVVGPHAADINGLGFSDLAALFNFDSDGKISELLRKRDTWSGKTIWWPIEGTTLKVPVDLAALPTYTRTREFDGFRGFGIVRVADVAEDPLAIGVTLAPTPAHADTEEAEDYAVEEIDDTVAAHAADDMAEPASQEDEIGTDAPSDHDADETSAGLTSGSSEELPLPEEEKPALHIVETPARRHSDKIIQLEERRFRKDGLTAGEQAAFREIGRRLDTLTDHEDMDEAAAENLQSADEHAGDMPEEEVAPVSVSVDDAAADQLFEEDDTGISDAAEAENENFAQADIPLLDTVEDGVADENDEQEDDEPHAAHIIPVRARLGLNADILDQMPVALIVHAGDRLFHANPEFLRLTGYASLEELEEIGGLDALLQRDDLDATTSEAGGMVVVRADDALLPVSARLQSIRWEQSTALMLALMPVAVATEQPPVVTEPDADVSETIEDEDLPAAAAEVSRLQVEVDELRAILETATDGVVIIGAEGDVRSMNQAASGLFNYDHDETVGRPFVMLFAHESQRSVIDYLGGLSGHGVASVLNDGREVIGREAGGGFLPLFMTIGRLTSSNGYCAVIRDITAWKRTEEELRNAKRAAETANAHKSEFLAHVSHEIRTPLNAIIGFSDMMATERFGPIGHPRYIEYANDIGRSGRHVLDIVNDLLDISKIEAGEMELEFEAVGLNETVSEAVSLIQPQANGQRVIIRTALSQSVPQVVADLRSIKQIVLNILSNAIRFTPSGGQIVVSTAFEANGSVILRIRDTGIGMTRSELEMAMKPFRQVTGAARKRGDGTGLGLPLTKAMVDANRASFAITSAPNEGTLVEITFPSQRVLAN